MFINPGETGGWFFREPNVTILDTQTRDICKVNLNPEMKMPLPQGPVALKADAESPSSSDETTESPSQS
jgi:hypothetical protein